MIDKKRADPCEPFEKDFFSGAKALVFGGAKDFLGKVVFLSQKDQYGWWECLDRTGDMLFLQQEWLMPISKRDWDDSGDLDNFLYEARYGV